MQSIYANGLIVWEEDHIRLREAIAEDLIRRMEKSARQINKAWTLERIEAPIFVPISSIPDSYSEDDYFRVSDKLALRPETTAASYAHAQCRLTNESSKKVLPLCVVQSGLSFRREQDKTLKHLRLKQFYQLEFQFLYDADSKADYVSFFRNAVFEALSVWYPEIKREPSDRLPSYSKSTEDIVAIAPDRYEIEIASMSDRTDSPIPNVRNIEIAIGLDRLTALISNKQIWKEE